MRNFRVTPEGSFSSFGSYCVFPDSPDGSRIIYVKWHNAPTTQFGGDATLCMCDADFQNHKEIIELKNLIVHTGGGAAWVDAEHVQITNAFDGNKHGAAVVNVSSGKVVEGPFYHTSVQHEPFNGKVLFFVNEKDADLSPGIHYLDCKTSKITQICTPQEFAPWTSKMNCKTADPNQWHIDHPTWSPDGSRVAVNIDAEFCAGWWNYLWTMNPDGSDKIFFGTKPIHFEWYDEQSIWGNDINIPDNLPDDGSLRRWDLHGNFMENLAGQSNHGAISPDKKLFAGETWYDSSPVELYLYEKGSVQPKEAIMKHHYPETTWGLSAHVDPSFSRDGKRLFYNKAISKQMNEGWCTEL